MKSNNLIGKCPICSNKMEAVKLHCKNCNTSIEGRFHLHKFLQLTEEELSFVEVFIKNKGNIKEIEKELGISYPTVRNKLRGVVEALGYRNEKKNVDKNEILDRLEKGEISSEEAVKLLNE